jgi:cobalt-zinc-cadmium efflux system protein
MWKSLDNHSRDCSDRLTRPLVIAMAITATFTLIEFVGGLLSDSLALMSDAGHMLTDTIALGLSLAAVRIALRPPTEEKTFGFLRAEILAAFINGSTLVVITLVIFYEAAQRLLNPPKIDAPLMLVVAVAGLAANASGVFVLRDRSKSNLNVRGASLHMMGDLLSSVGVILGALLIMFFGVQSVDPILSILIGAVILFGAWRLISQSTMILLESVPSHVRLNDVKESLLGIEGVVDVHDLHIWTLSSGLHALSAHVLVKDQMVSNCSAVIEKFEDLLSKEYAISHTTFQIECQSCTDPVCTFLPHR